MEAALTIIRYKKRFIFFAFQTMLIFRIPLLLNKNISFFKLLGTSRKGRFLMKPDWQQWGIITVRNKAFEGNKCKTKQLNDPANYLLIREIYGPFIAAWFRLFNCETFTVLAEPLTGHGTWDGKQAFGELPVHAAHDGMIAILTRASIRLNKVRLFWKQVAPVEEEFKNAKGLLTSFGMGELPFIKQATFSVWENEDCMKTFAYGMKGHREAIENSKKHKWFSEEMYIRFRITGSFGTNRGIQPLDQKL